MCPVALNATAAVPHCRDLMAMGGKKAKCKATQKAKCTQAGGMGTTFWLQGTGRNALDAPATGTEFEPTLNSGFSFSGVFFIHFSKMSLSLSFYPIRHDLLL